MILKRNAWYVIIAIILISQPRLQAQDSEEQIDLSAGQAVWASSDLAHIEGRLQISGFGIGAYQYAGNTTENTFSANKIALSAFEQVNAELYVFGQLTTVLEEEATETEIDNLILSYTPAGLPNLTIMGGRFDAPVGFERDDEPLNFQPSNSFNFEAARPVKYTGLTAMLTLNPVWDITAYVVNGWDVDIDNNKAKTFGTRLGLSASENTNLGLSFVIGFPEEENDRRVRWLTDLDYAIQPRPDWLLAGEINFGQEQDAGLDGQNAWWAGGQLTSYYQANRRLGVALRYDVLRDDDGARTGEAQTLQSFSIAPSLKVRHGKYGAYSNREHTTFGIPQFELRLEFRVNHSDHSFFDDGGDSLSQWESLTRIQTVIVF